MCTNLYRLKVVRWRQFPSTEETEVPEQQEKKGIVHCTGYLIHVYWKLLYHSRMMCGFQNSTYDTMIELRSRRECCWQTNTCMQPKKFYGNNFPSYVDFNPHSCPKTMDSYQSSSSDCELHVTTFIIELNSCFPSCSNPDSSIWPLLPLEVKSNSMIVWQGDGSHHQ